MITSSTPRSSDQRVSPRTWQLNGLGVMSMRRAVLALVATMAALGLAACSADGGSLPIGGGGGGGGGGDTTTVCTQPIGGPGATTQTATSGLCLGCTVNNPGNAIDDNTGNFAELNLPVGLLGGAATLTMVAPPGVAYPAGNSAGATILVPPGILAADVLPNVSVTTQLAGVEQETANAAGLLNLSALNTTIIGGGELFALNFPATQAFDGVSVTAASTVASVLASVQVFGGCGQFETVPVP